jgi:hypothetical protein
MNEPSYTSTIKLGNWETLRFRQRIERFNSRRDGQNEHFQLRLLPLDESASFHLEAILDEARTMCVMAPLLTVGESVKDFNCKIWLENIAGEKCPEIRCK